MLKRKTHAEFALLKVTRKMSLGKAGQDVMLLWVTVKCDEQGKDSQRHKCDFQPQNYLCCALFFTRLVYGADGVSAVVTVLKRTGQTSLEIWLRYFL